MQFTAALNSEPVEQALRAFQASLADQSPALTEIADDFRAMIAEQFASEGRAGGTPWAALAPSTARRRRSGTQLLNVTGALLDSLRQPGAPGHIEETDGQTLTLGSRLPYAMYHQTGTGAGYGQTYGPARVKGQRGMPMRPLIVLTPDRSERWTELVRQALEEKTLLLGPKELGGSL
jgi:phage gpG-like protein